MVPLSRTDRSSATEPVLTPEQQRQLLEVARASIMHRLDSRGPAMDLDSLEPTLRKPAACFVTLRLMTEPDNGETLRGCIGTLEAERPLAKAVAHFAVQAAFHDPRFDPVVLAEMELIEIEISLLSALTPLAVTSYQQLLQRLTPGVDGLWLEAGSKRATYLPQVWQQLPTPTQFVDSLKRKAGLLAERQDEPWDESFRWSTYQVQHFSE